MSLIKRNYVDGETVITAQNLNDIQDAIIALENGASGVPSSVRSAIFTILEAAAYAETGLEDELAIIESWTEEIISISLSASTLELNGDTPQTLIATVVPASASIAWTSSDEFVATVVDGVVTGVGNGSCTITASSGDKYATCAVSVNGFIQVESISATYTPSGEITDETPVDDLKQDLVVVATWSDSTQEIVSSEDYEISGTLQGGVNTLTVTYQNKSTTFEVTITKYTLYKIQNTLYEFGGSAQTDTGVKITDEDKDFTIAIDVTIPSGGQINSGSVAWCLIVSGGNPGLRVAKHSQNDYTNFRWMATFAQWNNFGTTTTGRVRLIVSHARGSGSATAYVKVGSASVASKTISANFSTVDTTVKLFSDTASAVKYNGTCKIAKICNYVFSADERSAFFA